MTGRGKGIGNVIKNFLRTIIFIITTMIINNVQTMIVSCWLSLQLHLLLPQITILLSHDQLLSGFVAQLVEQRSFVPVVEGSNPIGVGDFFLFLRVGPFSC